MHFVCQKVKLSWSEVKNLEIIWNLPNYQELKCRFD